MTVYDRIMQLDISQMAEFLSNEGFQCECCEEYHRLDGMPLYSTEHCDEQCTKHCMQWLKKEYKDVLQEKTLTKEEATKMLKSCGILDSNCKLTEAYKDILIQQ